MTPRPTPAERLEHALDKLGELDATLVLAWTPTNEILELLDTACDDIGLALDQLRGADVPVLGSAEARASRLKYSP